MAIIINPSNEDILKNLKKDIKFDPTGKEWSFTATTEIEHWGSDHVSYTTSESGKGSFSIIKAYEEGEEPRWEFDFFWSSPSGTCDSVYASYVRPTMEDCFSELKDMLESFYDIDIEDLDITDEDL